MRVCVHWQKFEIKQVVYLMHSLRSLYTLREKKKKKFACASTQIKRGETHVGMILYSTSRNLDIKNAGLIHSCTRYAKISR